MCKRTVQKKSVLVVFFFSMFILCLGIVSAADVAYIVVDLDDIEPEFISVLGELGKDYEIIFSSDALTTDFSQYKMMLLNNDYFTNWNEIPVNQYPAVIANGRHMDEWGWTKRMSVASQHVPFLMNINNSFEVGGSYNNGLIEVYNRSEPDVYYLDKRDIFQGLDIVGYNIYDSGDAIIALARAGTTLTRSGMPDTPIYADSCFFGITESEYWTPEARNLFKECINFVAVTCSNDDDCPGSTVSDDFCYSDDVYQTTTTYTCQNPGTSQSQCVIDSAIDSLVENCGEDSCQPWGDDYCFGDDVYHARNCNDRGCLSGECTDELQLETQLVEECDSVFETCSNGMCTDLVIECSFDSDCGTDHWLNQEVCVGDNIYDDFITYICNNPGLPSASCSSSTESLLKQECPGDCVDGMCVGCTSDNDCPDDLVGDNYCEGLDVYYDLTEYSCSDYECDSNTNQVFVEICDEACVDGECVEIECFDNLDCGTSGFHGASYCTGLGLYSARDFSSFVCENAGDTTSYCRNYTLPILFDFCEFGCDNGICMFECVSEPDCGDDFYSDNYCEGLEVVRDAHDFLCNNGSCIEEVLTENLEICDFMCLEGYCIECNEDPDCDDSNVYTEDECVHPGTPQSYCTNIPMNCIVSSDCGITGFIEEEYCFSDDVYKDYQTSDCIDPGTLDSHCDINTEPTLVNDCGENSCEDWEDYCLDNEIRTKRDCYDRGCLDAGCFSDLIVEDELVGICEFGCVDGECVDECVEDSDCGDDYYGDYYCVDDDRYVEQISPVCELGVCGEDIAGELIETCSYDCVDGECVDECVEDSDCGSQYYGDYYCIDDDRYVEQILPLCELGVCGEEIVGELIETCSYDCVDGECVDIICFTDDDCDDDDIYTVDECNNPGTTQSYCTNVPMNCLSDNDCGITGFMGQEFCSSDDVFKTYQIADCVNEGTMDSYCEVTTFPMLLLDCGGYECDDWNDNYCDDGNIYHSRNCYDNGCDNGMCFVDLLVDDDLVEVCEFDCEFGECLPECILDSDCGTDYCSAWNFICVSDDVWKRRSCYEYDCVSGSCELDSDVDQDFVQECVYGCSEGECEDECSRDSDCGTDSFSANYCLGYYVVKDFYDHECEYGSCVFDETVILVEKCSEECFQGECVGVECHTHSDCEDSNPLTYDKCNSAGQHTSFCGNTPITCAYNSHCNPGEVCVNPGSPLSYCS